MVLGILACGVFFLGLCKATAQTDDDPEYQVKLAFLYNFAQFIQWPAEAFSDSSAPLRICIAGPDPFTGGAAQALRGRTASGHRIEIKALKSKDDPRACHMIFVRAGEKNAVTKILSAIRGSNALTIGESKGFADSGGVINLTLQDNKLQFEINLDAALQTRLKISSKLLALAKIVKGETP